MIATSEMTTGKKIVGPTGFRYVTKERQQTVSSYVMKNGEMVFSPNWTAVVVGVVEGSAAERDVRDGFVKIGAVHSVQIPRMTAE